MEESISIKPWPERPPARPEQMTGEIEGMEDDDDAGTAIDNLHFDINYYSSKPWGIRWIEAAKGGDFYLLPSYHTEDKFFDPNCAPRTEAQIKFVDHITKEHKSKPLAQFLGRFKRDAQSTDKHARTEAQKWSCRNWIRQEWMDGKVFNYQTGGYDTTDAATAKAAFKKYKKTKATAFAQSSAKDDEITFLAAENLGLVKNKEIHPHFGDPARPKVIHHPTVWMLWHECFRETGEDAPIAFRKVNGQPVPKGAPIPIDYVRTHIRLTPILNFWKENAQDAGIKTAIKQIYYKAMLLLAVKGDYEKKIVEGNLQVETYTRFLAPPSRFKTGEVSRNDIAAHLASCGYTITEADDALSYSRTWLAVAANNNELAEKEAMYAKSLLRQYPYDETNQHVLNEVPYVWHNQLRRWILFSQDLCRVERARRSSSSILKEGNTPSWVGIANPSETPNKELAHDGKRAAEDQDMSDPLPPSNTNADEEAPPLMPPMEI